MNDEILATYACRLVPQKLLLNFYIQNCKLFIHVSFKNYNDAIFSKIDFIFCKSLFATLLMIVKFYACARFSEINDG